MLVHYKIDYRDEISDGKHARYTGTGIASASSLGEAVDKIVDLYGKENIICIEVYEMYDTLMYSEIKSMVEDEVEDNNDPELSLN